MAAKKDLKCSYLRNQRSDRLHFNAYLYYIVYNLSPGSRCKHKNGWRHHANPRWPPKNILNVHILGTDGPIDFISTPTCTISITTYHLDHVTSIRIDDVIMQFQDGRQKTFTMLISQEPTLRSTLFQRLLYYIDYNLSLGSRSKDKNWWRHHAIATWPLNNTSGDLSKTSENSAGPQETSVGPQETSVYLRRLQETWVTPQETSVRPQETSVRPQ